MTKEKLEKSKELLAKIEVLQEILDESRQNLNKPIVSLVLQTDRHTINFEKFAPKQYNEMWRKAIEVIQTQYEAYEKEFNEL